MSDLAQRQLIPPRGEGQRALEGAALTELYTLLGGDWALEEDQRLSKTYTFPNFERALSFTNQVGALAEDVDHHPEICLTWGKATITIWTHSIRGLSEADFVFAARCDAFFGEGGEPA